MRTWSACNAFLPRFAPVRPHSRFTLEGLENVADGGEHDEEDEGGGEERVAQDVDGEEELAHDAARGVPDSVQIPKLKLI